jgi:hydrogenase/urease accessory protein HupE
MRRRDGKDASPTAQSVASNGVGLAIAGVLMAFFTMMPFLLLVVLYLFLSGYAIVHGIASGQGEDAVTIVVGFVLATSLFALLIAVAVNMLGRSITPRKRRDAGS